MGRFPIKIKQPASYKLTTIAALACLCVASTIGMTSGDSFAACLAMVAFPRPL